DGLSLYFSDDPNPRPDGYGDSDIWVVTRATTEDNWGTPVNLGPTVNSSLYEGAPSISADGRSLFFESTDDPGAVKGDLRGNWDLWVTTRATIHDDWSTPVKLPPHVNTGKTFEPSISGDGSTLYFCSNLPGGQGSYDLWQVPMTPIVDLNGDSIVDALDMCVLVDHWGQNEPSCDIAPGPFGDGIIDVQDLVVLAEHLFEAVDDPTLIAYWALDETEGITTHESVGGSDDVVMGSPYWQPTGGMVDGALELDGIDDYITTSFGHNPADGPFSVFAWIKGGTLGQVIISQTDGVNWLAADTAGGHLMTELRFIGGRAVQPPLVSQTVITDGQWHRIGFVWDEVYRAIYVDDALVAEDSQPGLADSLGGLNIGCGSDLAAGTFWSGLIDDVRIYNRAVRP
ncbi:MAG: PD40 domain-containing protein, partial [Phycisphaerales bacterium]